jgi:hypothetical protein
VISSLVSDWHSQSYLLNILTLTAELKGPSVEQGLDDIVARLELLIPDNKVDGLAVPKERDLGREKGRTSIL